MTDKQFKHVDISDIAFDQVSKNCIKYTFDDLQALFQPRSRLTHKGDNGHVVVIGGDYGFAGATTMAAEAALRVGAGLVSVATRKDHAAYITSACPEVMCHAAEDTSALHGLLKRATTVVLGPGLGQSAWAHMMLNAALDVNLPTVLDADGLNILAKSDRALSDQCILTPHSGEAARLIACSVTEIQNDRLGAIRTLRDKYKKCIVLKGAGTLILDEHVPAVLCEYGNPGMSSGGMGDVLSGVIGGLLAQGFDTRTAAILGVYVHSFAADLASKDGERGMRVTDLMPYLRHLVNIPKKF